MKSGHMLAFIYKTIAIGDTKYGMVGRQGSKEQLIKEVEECLIHAKKYIANSLTWTLDDDIFTLCNNSIIQIYTTGPKIKGISYDEMERRIFLRECEEDKNTQEIAAAIVEYRCRAPKHKGTKVIVTTNPDSLDARRYSHWLFDKACHNPYQGTRPIDKNWRGKLATIIDNQEIQRIKSNFQNK